MNTFPIKYLAILIFFCISTILFSQEKDKKEKWDVNTPGEPFNEVTIETDEGTWMNLDVSPEAPLTHDKANVKVVFLDFPVINQADTKNQS